MLARDEKVLGRLLRFQWIAARGMRPAWLSIALLLSGCVVPNAVPYYAPSMEGGRVVEQSRCVPTKSVMAFGNLPLHASVIHGANGRWQVLVSLPLPKPRRPAWKSFHFMSSDFYFRFAKGEHRRPAKSVTVYRDDRKDSLLEPYLSNRPRHWSYYVDVWLPEPPGKGFDFYVPPVMIDGHEYRYPPIHFERKLWVGISPFNC